MITVLATLCFFATVKTFDTVDLQVKTIKFGQSVTIKCNLKKGPHHYLSWYKQSFGKVPQFIVRSAESNEKVRFSPTFKKRFKKSGSEKEFDLSITQTVEEDAGTYFCVKVTQKDLNFGSGTLLLPESKKHNLTQMDVESGESAALQCSVLMATLSCAGEHSVYWFRHGSGESHPGVIYTHGDPNSQCVRGPESASPTNSCVYKLPKKNLSLSDSGTYYCAVAACGHILFGNGTKLTVKENDNWIVIALTTSNVISVIVIVVLAALLLKCQRKGSFNGRLQGPSNQPEDTDDTNYAALKFAKKPPASRTPRVNKRQDIYSQVKVR